MTISRQNYQSVVNAKACINERFEPHSNSLNIYEALTSDVVNRQKKSRSEYNNLHEIFKNPSHAALMKKIKILAGGASRKQKKKKM
jgi:hypothetical protein